MAEQTIIKEFNIIEKTGYSIGAVLMVKDEEKRICVTLNSVVNFVDCIIIYDTGSTDKTLDIINSFAEKHKINTYIKKGTFTNFAISRNECLSFADTIPVDYFLLLDSNDELRGGKFLTKLAKDYKNEKEKTGFLLCQQWYNGNSIDKYYNIRFIKSRSGWTYKGCVHEWISDTDSTVSKFPTDKFPDSICIYQDRIQDSCKSSKRFSKDRELLLEENLKNPKDPRTLFYLAQTCHCLKLYQEAYEYSKQRLELQGFTEERFHSYMRCGACAIHLDKDWSEGMSWFLKAYEEFNRAEPLVKIAEYYSKKAVLEKEKSLNYWQCAYTFLCQASKLDYPSESVLFVDKYVYDYVRWHLLGIVAFYVGDYNLGKNACLKAISQNVFKEQDEKNLQFYLEKEKQIPYTRETFIESKVVELANKFPNTSKVQLIKRAHAMWKKRKE